MVDDPDNAGLNPPSGPGTSTSTSTGTGQHVLLRTPVDVRSVSLAVLALLASLFALQWAKEILVPILFGVMMSYALTPIVNRLQRWRLPRGLASALLLSSLFGSLIWGTWALSDQVSDLVETLPQVTQELRKLTQHERGTVSTIEKVHQAATELEAAATQSSSAPPVAAPAVSTQRAARASAQQQRAVTQAGPAGTRPKIDIRAYLLSGTLGALAFLGQIVIVFFIALFLMASGNDFRRKMVKLAGPKLSQKKITIETLDEISGQIQRYLLVQVGISVVVGVATGLAFYAIGLNQAAVWGVVACVTNLVPYLGAILIGAGSAVVGLVQFGTAEMALIVGGSSFLIHTVIGNVLAPWWMGRTSRMSPVAVFITVLFFGWLWGVAGLLLGVPILLVVKAVCDRVEDLKAVGELLGQQSH